MEKPLPIAEKHVAEPGKSVNSFVKHDNLKNKFRKKRYTRKMFREIQKIFCEIFKINFFCKTSKLANCFTKFKKFKKWLLEIVYCKKLWNPRNEEPKNMFHGIRKIFYGICETKRYFVKSVNPWQFSRNLRNPTNCFTESDKSKK